MGKDAVDKDFNKLQQSCWCSNITRIANFVAANSDPQLVGICILGPIFTHDLGVRNFFVAVEGDIVVAYDMEGVSPLDELVLGTFISFSYSL